MPAEQRGSVYKTATGFGIRYYEHGVRRRRAGFKSRSEARAWFETIERKRLRGEPVQQPQLTLDELCERFLSAHAVAVQERTIRTLRQRLQRPRDAFGHVPLGELERQVAEIAAWRATLPERYRYAVMSAFRQTLSAGVRWGYMASNPAAAVGPNPQPTRWNSPRSRSTRSRQSPSSSAPTARSSCSRARRR